MKPSLVYMYYTHSGYRTSIFVQKNCAYYIRIFTVYYFGAEIFRAICRKFYQNPLGFVDDVIKTFLCFFGLPFQLPFTYNVKFDKVV